MKKISMDKRVLCGILAAILVLGILPAAILGESMIPTASVYDALEEAKAYIDSITINSSSNDPATVVKNFGTQFTWDNEKRESAGKSYLFDWSYYNGVVFEGIQYVYDVTGESAYADYVIEYMSAMIDANGAWAACTNSSDKTCAGYNATHGADCYKTASLLLDAYRLTGDDRYRTMASTLYKDLDTAAESYSLPNAGNNYRHTWASDPTPDLWLDGLYMILPFRAEYAAYVEDQAELDLIVERMQWVSDNMYDESTGLFYHAADSATSNSGTFWLRSIGWYAAAMVDIMDSLEGENLQTMQVQLKKLVDGMKACQNEDNGMWLNNMAAAQSSTNPYETSGTALVCYAVMKAVNNGWLDSSYSNMAALGFEGICEEKLSNNNLTDICFKGAPGSSNSTFYDNEGKGLGPFIMLYAEVQRYVNNATTDEPEDPQRQRVTVTDSASGITVTSWDITGVTAQLLEDSAVSAALSGVMPGDVLAYDITVTGYMTGDSATVSFPVPEGADPAKYAVYHVEEDGDVEYMPGILSADRKSYIFVTDHFSVYVGGEIADDATIDDTNSTEKEIELPGSGGYTYELDTDGVDAGGQYIIANGNYGTAYALTNNNNSVGRTRVTINDGEIVLTEVDNDILWTFSGSTSGTVSNNGRYLYPGDKSLSLNISGTNLNITNRGSGQYWISRSGRSRTYYLRYSDSEWTGGTSSYNVYLYKLTSSPTPGGTVTFRMSPETSTMALGATQDMKYEIVLVQNGEEIEIGDNYEITWESKDTSVATVDENGRVTAVGSGTNTSTKIYATLTSVNNIEVEIQLEATVNLKTWDSDVEFTVSPNPLMIHPNGTISLIPEIKTGGQSVMGDITWEVTSGSDYIDLATGDTMAVVEGLAEGEAVVTATLRTVGNAILESPITVKIPVTVAERTIIKEKVTISGYTGTVYIGSNSTVNTGAFISIPYSDGTIEKVPVKVGMLTDSEGNPVSTAAATVYDQNLTVTYGEFTYSKFTLNVVEQPDMNYPEYPTPGSISTNKYIADYSQFQDLGIAEVHLTTSGLPYVGGVDVVLVADISNSMAWKAGTAKKSPAEGENTKWEDLQVAASGFVDILLANANTDNTVSFVTFGGYDAERNSNSSSYTSYFDATDTLFTSYSDAEAAKEKINAIKITSEDDSNYAVTINGISAGTPQGGTNYDFAFLETISAINTIKSEYEANSQGIKYDNSGREIYVVFLTDGAPDHYNQLYYKTRSNSQFDYYALYNNASDTLGEYFASKDELPNYATFNQRVNKGYYIPEANISNPNWIDWIQSNALLAAEAVKAIPNVNSISAIGFDLANGAFGDFTFTEDVLKDVLTNLAGENSCEVMTTDDPAELQKYFSDMATNLAEAATNAYFVDQLGDSFQLQMEHVGSGDTAFEPKITVRTYSVYTFADVDGVNVTADMVGHRYGDPTTVEVVTFNATGEEAYSSVLPDNILADDGVIYAKSFWYNTTKSEVSIDTDGDDATDYALPPETFRWNIGTINNQEYELSYYVYLKGSAEGTMGAGTYKTNNFAILYYNNWLGNKAEQSVDSPALAWKSAAVYYGFYLVDEDGNPVTNRATGAIGSFADAVKVTPKMLHQEVMLNSSGVTIALSLQDNIPEGYTLYDPDASYTVNIASNSEASYWKIVKGQNAEAVTTYVTDYYSSDYTNVADSRTITNKTGYDYTTTTVWFAVVWTPRTLNDSVVIDYGLPVDIDVLQNDMFGTAGTITGFGQVSAIPNGNYGTSSIFGKELNSDYGSIKLNGTKVRYTPKTMVMPLEDTFAYEVRYIDAQGNVGYYYGTVTVIPATTIYYEDSFETDTGISGITYGGTAEWKTDGTQDSNATQAEDRPGYHSLVDANNIYGYDGVNLSMSTYSLGAAHKVTVTSGNYATATFTFTGTGFDVISLTSNLTGTIIVDVYKADSFDKITDINKPDKSFVVDTYYGYTKNADGEWVATGNDPNALYQVPVMKVNKLPYGTYTVVITAFHDELFDHTDPVGYVFYLDAIRIYDPANNGASSNVIENAYADDKEGWPTYQELRNLVIKKESFGDTSTKTPVTGLVFIDGNEKVGDAQLADYINFGPNNELYLKPGQRVAFKLSLPDNLASVQIGIKSADGSPASWTITNIRSDGTYANPLTRVVNTTTDMYYDITGYKDDIIVISNYTEDTGTTGILSITNIKFTYTSAPNAQQSKGPAVSTEPVIYMTAADAKLTVDTINKMGVAANAFTPDMDVQVNAKTAELGGIVSAKISTSWDVAYITVNGQKVTEYAEDAMAGQRIWMVAQKVESQGRNILEVVAYSADGKASAPVRTAYMVQKENSGNGPALREEGWISR